MKFDVKMTEKAMAEFMTHATYTSVGGIATTIVGLIVMIVGVTWIFQGDYSHAAIFILIGGYFSLGTFIGIKFKAKNQIKRSSMFKEPITYEFAEEGVHISQGEEHVLNSWDEFRNVIATSNLLLMYTSKTRAIVLPKVDLGDQYAQVLDFISSHVDPKVMKIRR